MKLIETVAVLSLLLLTCNAFEMSGHEACVKVRETLGSKAQCEHGEELLVFFQSSPIGNVVKFSKKSERTLRIECLNFRIGIDLNKIPHLHFEHVNKLELSECSVSTESLLSAIKASFKIRNLKFLSVTTTKEANSVTLTENFFKNVSELEELEMKTNFRVKYSEETFKPLKNLKSLKLQVHDIIALPFNVFVPLENVRNLVISNSGLAKYETMKLNITLNKCINMKSFTLVGIRWPILIETGLVNFVGPLKVSLQNNRLESMSAKTFEKASHIEEMYLSNNSIKNLPKDIFASLTSLNIVDLSFNQIKEFHHEIFCKSTSLEAINLSNNKIISIDRKLFSNLKYLKQLDLSHNQIKQINFATNIGVSNSLEVLELSHNKIQKFIGNMSCPNLSRLELSNNNLKRFFVDQFWNFSRQKFTVNLMQNSLESVDFRDITFSSNASLLINVDEEIICNCHTMSLYNFTLERLEINPEIYKKIKVFPEKIKCIKQSSETPSAVLDIQTKSITCPLDSPHQVFCPSFCSCERRPFDGFLIVKCANISTVPLLPHFKMLKDIRLDRIELDIAGNGVTDLPSKLRDVNYNDVTKIHASHNNIQSITVFNIPELLEFLDLKHNRLRHISGDVVVKFRKLHFLHLSNNPWNCSTAKDLVRFVKRYRDIEKDFNMVQCSSYQYFLEIETEAQCNGDILTTILLFIGLISISVFIVVCYIKREIIIEWIFIKDKLHLLEKTIDKIKLFDAIVCVCDHDKIFGKYIATKLTERPNQYKIRIILKDWAANESIPIDVLKGIRYSRRVIVILSEYFEESDWTRWNYFNTNTRIIFVVKGKKSTANFTISNMFSVKFDDPLFWDKLKYAMTHRKELCFDNINEDVEMQPLQKVITC